MKELFSSTSLRQPNTVLLAAVAGLCILGSALIWSGTASGTGGLAINGPDARNKADAISSRFGNRILREGMAGSDVRVLKGIVRYKSLYRGSPFGESFDRPTTTAVRRFQRKKNMHTNGVVNRTTARELVRSLPTSVATWYGPGLWGNGTACGKVLRPNTLGVAHKTLPCGTKVLIGYRGRYVTTTVIDRGPYGAGRSWDLTKAVSDAIGMTPAGVAKVRTAIVKRGRK